MASHHHMNLGLQGRYFPLQRHQFDEPLDANEMDGTNPIEFA